MSRHAYLIMAHDNPSILKRTLSLLDDKRNDLFLHIDKKSLGIEAAECQKVVCKSNLFFTKQMPVSWGGFSQIACELNLLKSAVKGKYDYYHLLSGVDLPIKHQDEIHRFFKEHAGTEFISFDTLACETGNFMDRVRYFHLLQDVTGRAIGLQKLSLRLANRLLITLQRMARVDRSRDSTLVFRKGTNWFSITHELASFLIENERHIAR